MQVKTVSWRQRSEPHYRRPTTSPQMPPKPQIPPDQTMSRTRSLSPTARVPFLSMAQTVKCQYPTRRKVPAVNPLHSFRPLQPSSVCILIVPLPPTESLRTKKTTTVTRKRRAKRTTWSLQPLFLVILSPKQTLAGTTVPQHLKALDLQRPAPLNPAAWTVLMTMVPPHDNNTSSEMPIMRHIMSYWNTDWESCWGCKCIDWGIRAAELFKKELHVYVTTAAQIAFGIPSFLSTFGCFTKSANPLQARLCKALVHQGTLCVCTYITKEVIFCQKLLLLFHLILFSLNDCLDPERYVTAQWVVFPFS